MIVSHKYKFIFIKNRKVAGTSVEKALGKICGQDDIITSDTPERSRVNPNDELSEFSRHYEGLFNPLNEILAEPDLISAMRALRDATSRHKYYNHMSALSVRSRLGVNKWNNYYKFCFERNPWDKMVSFYYWYNRRASDNNSANLNEFICQKYNKFTKDRYFPTDWRRYTRKNHIIVDDIFDYNDLKGNLERALSNAGVPSEIIATVNLPSLKTNTRKKRAVELTAASDRRINEIFERELKHFNYECPYAIS